MHLRNIINCQTCLSWAFESIICKYLSKWTNQPSEQLKIYNTKAKTMCSFSIMLLLFAAFCINSFIPDYEGSGCWQQWPTFLCLLCRSYFPFIVSCYFPAPVFSQVATTDFNGGSHDPLFALSRVMTGQILRPWEIMLAKSHKK